MVAYSSSFCLPCLEGTDSPCTNTGTVCEPSTVWCDLVDIVEAQLNGVDSLIGRTATAIPLASVTGSAIFGGNVEFDTVDFDTDSMVNLDVNPTVVTPRRNGIYMAYGRIVTPSLGVTFDGFIHRIILSSGLDTSIAEYPEISSLPISAVLMTMKLFRWENGVSFPFQLAYEGFGFDIQSARMSVWWVSDLP